MTKIILAFFVWALPTLAQDSGATALAAAGCGAPETEFTVKLDKSSHPIPLPEPGKATVVVISQLGGACVGCVIVKAGIDGSWVGAMERTSYSYFSISPGDHRICVAQQSRLKGRSQTAGAASLTAEAGNVYYVRFLPAHNKFLLKPVDPAEGPLLIKSAAFSTATLKTP
ncbi:MAG: hypothetical protein ABSG16_06645 [Candidatus Acidiferrum sp.]|jgi:hypothetical protein